MQYQSECLSALKSITNIHKPFEKTFMDAMKLFMVIPDRINFLQLGRYGSFSEQTYRNLFEHETFDRFAFNGSIISKHLTGKRKAIAIDPSYTLSPSYFVTIRLNLLRSRNLTNWAFCKASFSSIGYLIKIKLATDSYTLNPGNTPISFS